MPSSLIRHTQQTLAASKLPVELSDTILGVQYNKLLFNTVGYASVLSATDFLRQAITQPAWCRGWSKTAAAWPVRCVARSLRGPFAAWPVRCVARSLRGPFQLPRIVYSVYQDLMRNRPTELTSSMVKSFGWLPFIRSTPLSMRKWFVLFTNWKQQRIIHF